MDKKIKIMVIEDEELLLQAISRKLQSRGIEPISCTSAEQALLKLAELDELPDAIWLDYYLEDMNGLEFMNEYKKNYKWTKIPVLVVSNSASEDKQKSMMSLGAKGYILKAQSRIEDVVDSIIKIVDKGKL